MLQTLGQYKILDRIGAGGMGEVYRARDTRLGRTVAIKVLPADVADDPERRARLVREARASAALSHPNIAALYEIGEDQGHLFLVFEFVPGETLNTIIAGRPLNPRRAIDLAVQIADALADAHAESIVHRDIKPGNIIVTPKGSAKILDFGLATWTGSGAERDAAGHEATRLVTSAGTTLGTVAYMSPEQALGEPVDQRTDIFSLGIVLFEMLTGQLPFAGATPTALALRIVQGHPPAPSAINPSLPRELDAVVAKALAKGLDQRYAAAATLAAELRSIAAILDVRSGDAEPVRVGPAARRRPNVGAWIGLAVVAALGVTGWWQRASVARVWRHTVGPAPAPIIAVMPLELAGADESQRFFADGLTEDLITRLGQTPGLKVLGRSATRAYRDRSPRDVATELGAAVVLTGSVRPLSDQVKVTLELIDPRDGVQIWTSQYTRELKDIFAVQAQVAEHVAQALRVKLQPTAASARAASRLVDPKAYELYLRGRQATAERRLPEARRLYQQAIDADAGVAEAFAGLAESLHFDQLYSGQVDDPARSQRLHDAAARAYQLDPDLPQANLAMGFAAESLSQALGYMRRAIEVDSSYGEGYHAIGDAILDFDPARALAFYRRSREVDPRLEANNTDMATVAILLNSPDDARRAIAALRTDLAGFRTAFDANIDLDERRYDEALAKIIGNPHLRAAEQLWLQYVVGLRSAGRTADAWREASALVHRYPEWCYARAVLAGLTRERGAASEARQLAAPISALARSDNAPASALRCAATAAAALGDAEQTALLIDRVASREPWLRGWTRLSMAQTGGMALRGRVYPWMNIIDQPPVVVARQHLEAAYARERAEAQRVLAGLP